MPYLNLNTHSVYYHDSNPNGLVSSPLVLLHGLGSSGEDWPLQQTYFARHFPVLTVDLRGHGRSSMDEGWPELREFAHDVAAVLKTLGRSPAHILGLSLGGAVALQLALDDPDLVRSLTIVNAFAHFRVGRRGLLRTLGRLFLLLIGRMDWLGAWIASGIFPDPEQRAWRDAAAKRIGANPRGAYTRTIRAVTRFDVRARLGEIRVPTLIIAGELDSTVAMSAKELLAQQIPGAVLLRFTGSGHGTPYDAADRFNEAVLEFLLGVEQGSGAD